MRRAVPGLEKHRLAAPLFLLLATSTPSCFPAADSEDIKTSGLYAIYWVRSSSDRIGIDANLQVGSGISNDVRLSPGDSLVAYVPGAEIPLVEQTCGGKCPPGIFYSYAGTANVTAANTNVRIALLRPPEFESAPNSSVLLPSPHVITEPAADTYSYDRPLSRSQGKIAVRWAPVEAMDKVQARVTASCHEGDYYKREGNGLDMILLDANLLQASAPDGRCDLSVWVTLERTGTVDRAIGKGGTMTAVREQTIYIPSVP